MGGGWCSGRVSVEQSDLSVQEKVVTCISCPSSLTGLLIEQENGKSSGIFTK